MVLLMASMILLASYQLGQDAHKTQKPVDIFNVTNQLVWNQTCAIQKTDFTTNVHLSNSLCYATNLIGSLAFEMGSWIIEEGYKQGYSSGEEINSVTLAKLLKWGIYLFILAQLGPLILPLIAVIYIFCEMWKGKRGRIKHEN